MTYDPDREAARLWCDYVDSADFRVGDVPSWQVPGLVAALVERLHPAPVEPVAAPPIPHPSTVRLLFFGGPADGELQAIPRHLHDLYVVPVMERASYRMMDAQPTAALDVERVRYARRRFSLGYPVIVEAMVAEGHPVADVEAQLLFVGALARISWRWAR